MPKLKKKALVGIVMGSDSDLPIMTETARMLQQLGVPFDIEISSAHRSPERTGNYARSAAGRGLKVLVVGAGGAAHLAGVIAAETTLPVIGVPIASSPLGGTDALFSTVQMPGGVPVATMAVGKAGAVNAAIFAAQILATSNGSLSRRLAQHKREMARAVAEKSKRLKRKFRL